MPNEPAVTKVTRLVDFEPDEETLVVAFPRPKLRDILDALQLAIDQHEWDSGDKVVQEFIDVIWSFGV